jgi:hypothetical protein
MKKFLTLFFALFAMTFFAKAQISDDFESYTAFTVDPAGTWTYFDGDSATTYGIDGCSFTNSNYVGSCIVFNPSQTSPSTATNYPAHSGSQFLIMFNAVPSSIVHGSTTNDWLISPAISSTTGSILTLYAREITTSYGAETMNILYSTTGNNPSDFTLLQTEAVNSTSWTMYSYSIPSNATYVAINCTSNDVFGLCIDDISITPVPGDPAIASASSLDLGNVMLPNNNVVTVPVQTWNLTSALTASSSDAVFELSFDGTNFASTATISNPVDSTYTLHVRFTPTTGGTATGTITLSSTGATSVTIALTGNGIDCSNNPLPYSFAFDNVEQAQCWTTVDVNNDASGSNGAIFISTSGGYAFYQYLSTAAANDWLISPTFYIPQNGATASFDYQVAMSSYPEKFSVHVIPAGSTYTNAVQIVPTQTVTNTTPETQYIDLTNFAGQSIQIAIKVESDADQYYILFTNFFVGEDIPVTLTPNPSQINFGEVIVGNTPNNMLILNSTNLNEDIVLTTGTPYSISLNGTDYFSTITIPANSEFEVNDTVYVQYTPTAASNYDGMITIVAGTIQDTVILSGSAIVCDAITTLPHEQNFDNVNTETSLLPGCWVQLSPYSGYPKVTSSYAHSGQALEFHANSSTTTYAIMPLFDEELSNLQINFWTRREGTSSGTLSVGFITNPTDASTFVPTWSMSSAEIGDNDYHEYTVRFTAAENVQTAYIAFRYEASSIWYWYVDDITVDLVPDCSEAMALNTISASNTSAELTWDGGNSTQFNLHYMSLNDSIDHVVNGVQLNVDGVYTLENLSSSTEYEWYIETVCTDSTYASAHAFFTTAGCAAEDQCTITIVGEDSFGDGWNGNAINIMQSGVTVGTFTLPSSTSSLTESFSVCSGIPVSFSWVSGSYASETSFEIHDGGNSVVFTGAGSDMVGGNTFFTMNDACPSCLPASALTVDAATETSITISWTGTAASYDIYNGEDFVANVTATTYTFNSLTASTGYVFGVQAICSATDSAIMATIIATTSCATTAINLPFTETFDLTSGSRNCWTTIDADNDGFNWTTLTDGTGADQEAMLSYSFDNSTLAALNPDNWLVSPKLHSNAGSTITMQWSVASAPSYPAEHYGVYVSTTVIDTNAFTMVDEWTISNGNAEVKNIDLSAYAGQDFYVAFRHHNCTDQYVLMIDNVQIYEGTYVPDTLTVTFAVNNATMGTTNPVPGSYQYIDGETVNFSAVPNAGYHFVTWEYTLGSSTTVQTFDSQSAYFNASSFISYGNISFTAIFEAGNPDSTTITYAVNDATMGTTTPAPGTYTIYVGNSIQAAATPNAGYELTTWILDYTQNGTVTNIFTIASDDTDFENPITFGTVPQSFVDAGATFTVTAVFAASTTPPTQYTVTLNSADATMGTVSPAGTTTVDEGTPFTATATANDGYHFLQWIDDNGNTFSTNPYTFTVTGHTTLTATFEANDPQVTYYNVTVTSANTNMGNVSSTASGQVAENTEVTVTATALEGYRFVNWTNDAGTEVSTDNPYTFTVTEDITLIANFELIDAIEDITLAQSISLMPNPADNYIVLSVNSNVNVKEAVVYNAFGQLIQTVQLTDNHARIDLSNMAAGMYFVRVNGEGVSATKKFIKK